MRRRSRTYPSQRPSVTLDWTLTGRDRAELRRAVAEKWLAEQPYTSYRYNVERCSNRRRVYLLRPTHLNKGFDFQVNLESFRGSLPKKRAQKSEKPSHGDIFLDLQGKLAARPDLKAPLYSAICDVFDCAEPAEAIRRQPDLTSLAAGLPVDQLLCVLKWLFMEQDLTYWLYSGRDKLMSGIEVDLFSIRA